MGQSINPQHWSYQHMKNPLTITKEEVLKYQPFEHNFKLKLLHAGHNKLECDRIESQNYMKPYNL